MPTIDQVEIPSLLIVETSAPSAPASGDQVLYIDPADHILKRKDSGGSVHNIENAGALTHSYLGYNTAGGSVEAMTQYRVFLKKISPGSDGFLASIGAYIQQNADNVVDLSVAVFSDSAGSPLRILAYNANPAASIYPAISGSQTKRWVQVPIGFWVIAGDYWIAVQSNAPSAHCDLAYDGSGSDRYYTAAGAWFTDAGHTSVTTGAIKYSIRADFVS